MYEVFDHTADIGIRVKAATLEELFREAAEALFSLIVTNLTEVEPRQPFRFSLALRDKEYDYLLFDWLNELLYRFETDKILFSAFELRLSGNELIADCRGEAMDISRHQMDHEVKAITYHCLQVKQMSNGWHAELIVDI